MKTKIQQSVQKALSELGVDGADVRIEHPAEISHGDYATGVALQYSKQIGMASKVLAEKIVETLGEVEGVSKIEIAGPGFINFHLAPSILAASLESATHKSDLWGRGEMNKGKKIMVEYTDPNPFKEFHIGHLMSNAIGESVSRLVQFSGAEVKRANYQGDVGPHVAKAIWGMMKLGLDADSVATIGQAYVAGAKAYEEDSASKSEIDAINAKVYEHSDAQIDALYTAGREASLVHFEEIYKTLGTAFDFYFFESTSAPKGLEIVKANPAVFEESDGAVVYKGEKVGLHTRVFITSRGLPTYEAKELGLAVLKEEAWNFDTSITITAQEQKSYFAVVLAAMKEVMPEVEEKIRHITHGMMRFADGKMSSRTGNVITGESLLADLTEAALVRAKESRADDVDSLAQSVAVAAIKYQVLKQASGKDIVFDRERALSMDGDSGPYLQYAHARTHQVVEKAKAEQIEIMIYHNFVPDEISRLVYRFPEIVEYAAAEMEPHLLTNYLLQLAAVFNSWYAQEQILDGTPAAAHKVAITDAVRNTLKKGLWILGIPAPEKM